MELDFNTRLTKSRDIDLYDFNIIDKEYDYSNDMTMYIKWRIVLYAKSDFGITDMYAIIDSVDFEMDYSVLPKDDDDYSDEERNYKLNLPIGEFLTSPLGSSEYHERKNQSYEDKKWVVKKEYEKKDDYDTAPDFILKSVEIDWEHKELTINF